MKSTTSYPYRRVALLFGGVNGEHDVSVASAQQIFRALVQKSYEVLPIYIDADGAWRVPHAVHTAEKTLPLTKQETDTMAAVDALASLKEKHRIDAVYLALHGTPYESGALQGILEIARIPYTGSGVAASALAMHKELYQDFLASYDIRTPQSLVIPAEKKENISTLASQIEHTFGFPCFLKPVDGGSSVGNSLVQQAEELPNALKKAFALPDVNTVLVQEYINDDEVTCGVIEDLHGKPFVLPVTLIRPLRSKTFDYESKYTPGASEELTPAPLPEEITKRIQVLAIAIHEMLGCRGLSRTDMILRDEEIIVLETNTLPGMTRTSLLPQAAQAADIPFADLVDRILLSTTHERS